MKFALGYQLPEPDEAGFASVIDAHADRVAEVYFAPLAEPSGRSPVGGREGRPDPEARERFYGDLQWLRARGIQLDLLFNANCYGADAMSLDLERRVVGAIRDIADAAGEPEIVTTTSPAVAYIVQRHFPRMERRASVNMRIGSVEGMRYLAHLFDGYYVRRDVNRDLEQIDRLLAWAGANDKRLYLLVNSGCLRDCSGQTFHDNLVAHESAVSRAENLPGFMPYTCWNFLRDRRQWSAILQATWIRPEDIHRYASRFERVKLATRMHERPHMVLAAYARGRFDGNLVDLLEPGFSPILAPWVIDNTRFPPDWFERYAEALRRGDDAAYCAEVLSDCLVRLDQV